MVYPDSQAAGGCGGGADVALSAHVLASAHPLLCTCVTLRSDHHQLRGAADGHLVRLCPPPPAAEGC